jgi:hypothetical protein
MMTEHDPKHQMSEDEIIADLLATAFDNPADKHVFATMAEGELIRLHHGFGTGIRNAYGLWHEGRWGTECAAHPDDVSMRIIERLWAKAREESAS